MKSKSYTRPGVEAAARLVSITQSSTYSSSQKLSLWSNIEAKYTEMLEEKGGKKLKEYDARLQEIGEKLRNGKQSSITLDELFEVVNWKFLKGKPRHALMNYLRSNSDTLVKDCSERSFAPIGGHMNDTIKQDDIRITNAMNALCELKGVGPATASAILGLIRPDLFAFMDDEVIECLYEKKRGYTLKIYLDVNTECHKIAADLGNGWNPW
eukprot:CAMPEP_0184868264 /NCGR_PEP_ID=MMETSP0580-20130426/29763_1 /TAXON_ID=1118495 /ORGANISM="Dactyliosolen fragilissimus" /LENGTH=210 /DNA_ID=CAMNT_0027369043 /DNA_START=103 /DNA_END=732 /DNA_ORIENTATION=-